MSDALLLTLSSHYLWDLSRHTQFIVLSTKLETLDVRVGLTENAS